MYLLLGDVPCARIGFIGVGCSRMSKSFQPVGTTIVDDLDGHPNESQSTPVRAQSPFVPECILDAAQTHTSMQQIVENGHLDLETQNDFVAIDRR